MNQRRPHTPRRNRLYRQQLQLRARAEQIRQDAERNFIYAIGVPGESVKFGKSVNPTQRLSNLQSGCPVKLTILGYIEAPEVLERQIHGHLCDHRIHGEWFRHGDETQAIIDLIVAGELAELLRVTRGIRISDVRRTIAEFP